MEKITERSVTTWKETFYPAPYQRCMVYLKESLEFYPSLFENMEFNTGCGVYHQIKEKEVRSMKTKFKEIPIIMILLFGGFLLTIALIFTASTAFSQQSCYCCIKGEVVQMTPAECKEKGGVCYKTKDEAMKRCQPQTCWCCVKGEVVQMTPKECKEKGGVCYTTKDEALKKCKPQDDCRKKYPNPQIKFDHIDKEGRVYIPVVNWAAYSNEMFRSAPELPPCGLNTNSSRTWVDIYDADTNNRIYGFCAFNSNDDLKTIWFLSKAKKGRVYIILQDRACKKNYKSNTITW